MAKYATCKKCGQRHTTLVRHKCPTTVAKRATKDCEITEHDIHEGTAGTDLSTMGDGMDKGDEGEGAPQEGDGEADGEGEETEASGGGVAKGEGEGEGDSESEAESETEGEGEGPQPQPPEPEAPPVAVVVTVLKFAALTAASAEAFTKIELGEDGLIVICLKGDCMATALMPWGEFEKRSTVDGEFWAKDVIDATAREVLEKAEAEPEFAEVPDDDGWIEWDAPDDESVEPPVSGWTRVEVMLRHYSEPEANIGHAGGFYWNDLGDNAIVKYRLV